MSVVAMLSAPAFGQQFVEQSATRFPQPAPTEYSSQCTVGDLDGDGDLDIIWANGAGFNCPVTPQVLRFYFNNGAGVFTDGTMAATNGLPLRARGVELGDVDNDGDLDVIVANDCNNLPTLLINNGSGVFSNQTGTRLPNITLSCSRAQFADIDNDGDLDLYLVNGGASRFGTGQGKIYLNNGLGFFTDATATLHPQPGTIAQPMDCIFGDVDGDFDLDLHLGSRGSNSKLFINNGSGLFTESVPAIAGGAAAYSYDFGDINGDGDLDLLGANGGPSLTELLLDNNGAGVFTNVSSNIMPNPSSDDNDTKFFDYDNDGDLDIIVAVLGGSGERIYRNNGGPNPTFTQMTGLITGISDSSLDVKIADFDGDGRLDIVTAQGESGSFLNRIYMNLTGPVDTIPPTIVRTEQVVASEGQAGPYVVRVVIYDSMTSDRGFFDKGIFLNYSVNGGRPAALPMRWMGNSMWRGVIPAQPCGGTIEYHVTARDFANNLATGPTLSFEVEPGVVVGDLNGDCHVTAADLGILLGSWGNPGCGGAKPCDADLNGDGNVGAADLGILLGNWG